MGHKKIAIAALIFACPYVVGSVFVFVFLIPVLFILFSRRPVKILYLIAAFTVFWGIALVPLIVYDPRTYVFCVAILSVFLALFLSISAALIRMLGDKWVSVLVPCVVWMGLLFTLDFRSLMTSIYDVGIQFPISAPLIWYAGSVGITALLILFNSAVACFLARKDKISLYLAIALMCAFIASYIFSATRKVEDLGAALAPVKLALIQGDVPRTSILGYTDDLEGRISRYAALSKEAIKEGAEFVVWPEYALPVDVMNRFPKMMEPITALAKTSRAGVILGSMITDPSTRSDHDAAILLGPDGKLKDSYYSQYPAIFNRGVRPGKDAGNLFFGNAGITLCWEEINPKICRAYVKKGAGYFISLSSNADLDYSWLKRYASYFTRARAAENMRYFARAAQTGVTHFIDPFGRVVSSLPQGKVAFLKGETRVLGIKTFYSSYGDVFAKVLTLLFSALVLAGLIPALRGILIGAAGGRNEKE